MPAQIQEHNYASPTETLCRGVLNVYFTLVTRNKRQENQFQFRVTKNQD